MGFDRRICLVLQVFWTSLHPDRGLGSVYRSVAMYITSFTLCVILLSHFARRSLNCCSNIVGSQSRRSKRKALSYNRIGTVSFLPNPSNHTGNLPRFIPPSSLKILESPQSTPPSRALNNLEQLRNLNMLTMMAE